MDRKRYQKRRNILYLIESFLIDMGFNVAAKSVRSEAKLTDELMICDNVNLETIVVEFETFYYQRFKTYPQLCKRNIVSRKENVNRGCNMLNLKSDSPQKSSTDENGFTPDFIVYNAHKQSNIEVGDTMTTAQRDNQWVHNDDWKEYVNLILRNMAPQTCNTRWKDIKGLDQVKNLLQEAVIYPSKYPHLFDDSLESWKSMLLYGPPGTGKTLLAKTAANESSVPFFNVSPSMIVSKWRGDSEKLIRVVFEMALLQAPSIIFIDEIDSFACKRTMYEHEASRRMKSEMFTAFDTVLETKSNVFILAATNTPWDLDEAILRRFEKRIYIGLPEREARQQILEHFLFPAKIEINSTEAAEMTEKFTGNDLKNLCKEIKMHSLRRMVPHLELQGFPTSFHECNITDDQVHDLITSFKPSKSLPIDKYTKWETEGC